MRTPTKTYRIGDVAELLDLKTYVLRFWETEFKQLRPHRTPKGQRIYTEKDVAVLKRIQYLLHEKGMTIEGARRKLSETPAALSANPATGGEHLEGRMQSLPLIAKPSGNPADGKESLREILAALRELRNLLTKD